MSKEKSLAAIETDRIIKEFKDIAKSIVDEAVKSGYKTRDQEIKNYFKQTEKRLYSYPELKDNLIKYDSDIEDLRKEKYTSRSKDIVRIPEGTGIRLTPEEIQETRIMNIQHKKERDQREINEIEAALDYIKNDNYYFIIQYKYFDRLSDAEIGERLNCDDSTVRRNKSRLVHRIALKFYGADVNT